MDIQKIFKIKLTKLKPIGDSRGFIATTHLDRHGERLTLKHLQKAKIFFEQNPYITLRHDISKLPIGKATRLFVKKMTSEDSGLYANIEIFDKDTLKKIKSGKLTGMSISFKEKND